MSTKIVCSYWSPCSSFPRALGGPVGGATIWTASKGARPAPGACGRGHCERPWVFGVEGEGHGASTGCTDARVTEQACGGRQELGWAPRLGRRYAKLVARWEKHPDVSMYMHDLLQQSGETPTCHMCSACGATCYPDSALRRARSARLVLLQAPLVICHARAPPADSAQRRPQLRRSQR